MENEGNGTDRKIGLVENESKTVEQLQKEKEIDKQTVTVGVDGEGFFVVRVHTSQNPLLIIGVLEDAKAQYRGMMMEAKRKTEELKNASQNFRGFRPSTLNFLNKMRGRGR